jgi:acyl-coenzyme A thioesterase PaaI-like protein
MELLLSTEGPTHAWFLPEDVDADWAARRQLADALRALTEACVTSEASIEQLEAAQKLVEQARELLPSGRTAAQAFSDRSYFDRPGEWIDRGALLGHCNPVAPPMKINAGDGHATATVVLGERHVGAPGIAHGGILAACFDQVCGYCAVVGGHPGLTVNLDVRYRKPAHVGVELEFSAEITRVSGRGVTVEATCTRDGEELGTCRAVFIKLEREQGLALFGGE